MCLAAVLWHRLSPWCRQTDVIDYYSVLLVMFA